MSYGANAYAKVARVALPPREAEAAVLLKAAGKLQALGPERYHLYLGAAFDGSRLSKLYREDVTAGEIRGVLDPLFAAYARDRQAGERFGDFVIRAGFVARTTNGPDFHERTGPLKAA